MAGNITTTQLNDSIATIVAADVLGYLKANTVAAQLVRRDYSNEVATRGQVVQIPVAGSLTVNDKAEGSKVTLQQPADDKVSITLNKHKEISFLIEDFAKTLATPDYLNVYTNQAVALLAEQIDSDLLGQYASLTGGTIDASGAAGPLATEDFIEARRLLNAAKMPLSNRFAVLGEDADAEYVANEEAVNMSYAATLGGAVLDAYSGRFAGFQTFLDQKVASSASLIKNIFMHKDALALVTRPLAGAPSNVPVLQKVMEEGGIVIRVTMSYNADYLGVQVTIDTLYGVGIPRPTAGVVVSTTDK